MILLSPVRPELSAKAAERVECLVRGHALSSGERAALLAALVYYFSSLNSSDICGLLSKYSSISFSFKSLLLISAYPVEPNA